MRVAAEWLRDDLVELRLDLLDRFAAGEAGSVAHAEHVRVDGEGFLAKGGVEYHVGGLAADARKGLQLLAR